ncbi:MAG TPA: phosphatase PAP2 family protein, partial [Nitriliruptorales bacterium]
MPERYSVSPMRRARVRHASDVVRVVVGAVVLALASLPIRPDRVGRSETGAFDLVNGLTDLIYGPVWVVMQLGALAAVPVLVIAALLLRRRRLALDLGVVGAASWLVARFLKDAFGRPRPGGLLEIVAVRGSEAQGMGFVSGHTAVAVGLATAAAPHLPRRYRWILWAAALAVGL